MVILSYLHSRSMWCSNLWGLLCQCVDTTFYTTYKSLPAIWMACCPFSKFSMETGKKAAPITWMALFVYFYCLCLPWGCIEFDYSCVLGLIECVIWFIVSYIYIWIIYCNIDMLPSKHTEDAVQKAGSLGIFSLSCMDHHIGKII